MEIKKEMRLEEKRSNLTLESRKKLSLTGVLDVNSFNEEKIVLNTNMGILIIKGTGLKMNKLDVQNGEVLIAGNIESCAYIGNELKSNKDSLISKLFK